MNKIKYWLLVVFLSVKYMFKQNPGMWIKYRGEKYQIINMGGAVTWRIQKMLYGEVLEVNRTECNLVLTPRNIIVNGFCSRYDFYMMYWYDIWCRIGIESWMKTDCNIGL